MADKNPKPIPSTSSPATAVAPTSGMWKNTFEPVSGNANGGKK